MLQATTFVPKFTALNFDPQTGKHRVALPGCVSLDDARAFCALHGDKFEVVNNSAGWLQRSGFTADRRSIKTTTIVLEILQELFDEFKNLFNSWVQELIKAREEATRLRKAQAASA